MRRSVVAIVVAAGLLGGGAQVASATPVGCSSQDPLPVPNPPKPALCGLVIMPTQNGAAQEQQPFPTTSEMLAQVNTGSAAPNLYASRFAGIAVDVEWSQLEPHKPTSSTAPLTLSATDTQVLDDDLAAVARYNRRHGTDLKVKLRVFGGFVAPKWAKTLPTSTAPNAPSGLICMPNFPTTDFTDPDGLCRGGDSLGSWWTQNYDAYWKQFQNALAAKYDNDSGNSSLIEGVQVTSCSTVTDEPMVVSNTPIDPPTDNHTELGYMEAAGLTAGKYEHCLSNALNDYSAWQHTVVEYPINSTPMAGSRSDADSQATMAMCAKSAPPTGPYCEIDNHGLGKPQPNNQSWYFSALAQVLQNQPNTLVAFQAQGAGSPGGPLGVSPPLKPGNGPLSHGEDPASINMAIDSHASQIELWNPYPAGTYNGFLWCFYPSPAPAPPISTPTIAADLGDWNTDIRDGTPILEPFFPAQCETTG